MKIFLFPLLFVVLFINGCFDVAASSDRDDANVNPFAQYELVSDDPNEFAKLVKSAGKGDAVSQYVLGTEYMYAADRTFRDIEPAILWLRKSADQGYLRAQKSLAMIYMPKFGDKPDAEEYFYWSMKAAEQGDAYSQLQVSTSYRFGEGVDQDFSEDLLWLRKSALNGEDEAQRILGVRYFEGTEEFEGNLVDRDYYEALRWLEKSAAQGNFDAEAEVIRILYNGDGVKKDYDKAFKLAKSYISDGISYGSIFYTLGEMYQYGRGTRQDINKAKESYRLSCDDDVEEGCDKYKELNK